MNAVLLGYDRVVTPELSIGAIFHDGYPGFHEDYLILHCLLRRFQPVRFMEIGTNVGNGTLIITNALGPAATVFSLDLPDAKADVSAQHPSRSSQIVGRVCTNSYMQLFGDSREYDYALHGPLDGFFIDAEHEYANVLIESRKAMACSPMIVIWHDCDMPGVWRGVTEAVESNGDYHLYRVPNTRMGFAIRNGLPQL